MTKEVTPQEAAIMKDAINREARRSGIGPGDILGKAKAAEIAATRQRVQFAMWAQGISSTQIGRMFRAHHTSVLYNIRQVAMTHLEVAR